MRRLPLFFVAAIVLSPAMAWPQGYPIGPEFRINTYTTGGQGAPDIAADPSGKFVVVWQGQGLQEADGIFGQRFDSSGVPLGPEFHVNTFTTSLQAEQRVAAGPSGQFVVVWQSYPQDGSGNGVFGQRYDVSGNPIGTEFRVNSYTTNFQIWPAIAAHAAGDFVVVWESYLQDGSGRGVFGQRFASTGAPMGPEFRVNSFTANHQTSADVAADGFGNFVVVWGSIGQDGSMEGVFGQRYDASGAPVGPEFRANTFTTGSQRLPSVGMDPAGNFVVVWTSNLQDGSSYGVFGQRYDATGTPLGAEFRVNTYVAFNQERPAVTADDAGEFVVVWSTWAQANWAVSGQRYNQIVPVELMDFAIE